MSARIWIKRRNKWRWRLPENVVDLGHERSMAERRALNEALGWWLDHPEYKYGEKAPP